MSSMSVSPDLFFGKTKLLFGSLEFGLVCCQSPIGLFGVVLLAVQPRCPLLCPPCGLEAESVISAPEGGVGTVLRSLFKNGLSIASARNRRFASIHPMAMEASLGRGGAACAMGCAGWSLASGKCPWGEETRLARY